MDKLFSIPPHTTFRISVSQRGHVTAAAHFLQRKVKFRFSYGDPKEFEIVNCPDREQVSSCIGVEEPLLWPEKWIHAIENDRTLKPDQKEAAKRIIKSQQYRNSGDKELVITVGVVTGNPDIAEKPSVITRNERTVVKFERDDVPGDYCEIKIHLP